MILLHEDAIYIRIISSFAVTLLFSILETLELSCKTHGVTGYALILMKSAILLTQYMQTGSNTKDTRNKSQKLEETGKKH